MSSVRVRRAVAGDASEYRALRLAALADTPDAFGGTLEREGAEAEEAFAARIARATATLLASLDGVPVGLAVVAPFDGDLGLFSVWVAPAGRGRGVGDALVVAAIEAARSLGAPRLLLDVGDANAPAIALYERHGFRPTGRVGSLPAPREHVKEHQRELRLG